jgi:Asp-tRNA(Asn)/Glu-tRNA(Gln) amidotransferase A subunit family amidase
MQIVGAPMSDLKVLALGRLYQENTDWHRRRPPTTTTAPKPA